MAEENNKTKILMSEDDGNRTVLEVIIKGRHNSASYIRNDRLDKHLIETAQGIARLLRYRGIGIGEYRVVNGKSWDDKKQQEIDGVKKANVRAYSNVNFAMLTQLMGIEEGGRLAA